MLATIYRDIVLSVRAGTFIKGDMRRAGNLFRQTQTFGDRQSTKSFNAVICKWGSIPSPLSRQKTGFFKGYLIGQHMENKTDNLILKKWIYPSKSLVR
jgi:hypothetical protein